MKSITELKNLIRGCHSKSETEAEESGIKVRAETNKGESKYG